VDVRTGAERILVKGSNEFIGPPTWAPTGARLAYVLSRGYDYTRLETCDLRGRRTIVVVDTADGLEPYGNVYPTLLWLDAHRLLYALRPLRQGQHRPGEWWSMRVDPATGRASGQPRQEYALPGAAVHSPSASRTGQVAFTAGRSLRELQLIGTDGRARYPELASGTQLTNLFFPIWSNDGRRLLVSSSENPSQPSIGWVGLADGRFERLPVAVSATEQPLRFTSDDRELLRVVGSRLVATRVADGVTRVVADPFPGIVLRAGRSDTWLALEHVGSDLVARNFSPATGPGAIRFRHPAKGLEEGITPPADLSPDGTRLVVRRGDAPGYDILDAANGRTLRRIDLPSKSYPQTVQWSPDGATLYASGMDGFSKYWIARLGARGVDRLIWRSEEVWPGDLAISPDGTTLAFTSLKDDYELWLMERP
jgi:Tol biopolymer transport system component